MNRREIIQRASLILGYAITGPALTGVLQGCKGKPDLAFKPIFFTADQASLISALTEIIIPRTETPGAIDVGVPGFIDRMLKEIYPKEGQDDFVRNLAAFNEEARANYSHDFIDCTEEEKTAHFKKHHDAALQDQGTGPSSGFWNAALKDGKPFIIEVKELTLLGFFTSEPGATQVLQYKAVPGPFKGCVPLAEVGKAWAT